MAQGVAEGEGVAEDTAEAGVTLAAATHSSTRIVLGMGTGQANHSSRISNITHSSNLHRKSSHHWAAATGEPAAAEVAVDMAGVWCFSL
jgi:hypothetical protein